MLWYQEYERSREESRKLEVVSRELELTKLRFSSMLNAEATLRQDPKQGPIHLAMTEFGPPTLRWTMDLKVMDDKQEAPQPAPATAEQAK